MPGRVVCEVDTAMKQLTIFGFLRKWWEKYSETFGHHEKMAVH